MPLLFYDENINAIGKPWQRTVLSLKVEDKTLKLLFKLHSTLQIQKIRFNLMLLVQIAAEYFEQTEHKVLN